MDGLNHLVEGVRASARGGRLQFTLHAHQEMVSEGFTGDDVSHALSSGLILENYPEHRRGACALMSGTTAAGRPMHIVCTTGRDPAIVITVYEPKPPKWVTPTTRGVRS